MQKMHFVLTRGLLPCSCGRPRVLKDEVDSALNELAASTQVHGPVVTERHTNYFVSGIADTPEQFLNLCWCLLGFFGSAFQIDFRIDSAIGVGDQATSNLMQILQKRLYVSRIITRAQKEHNRDPLLQELIAHVFVLIHQRAQKTPEWLGDVRACRKPHLNPNDSGIDLIAIGLDGVGAFPIIGEMKAYEKDPPGGLREACIKFTEVRNGEHNDEIRSALMDLNNDALFTRDQLADNIWTSGGKYGVVVGHDNHPDYTIDINFTSAAAEVICHPPERLFFICTPFANMRSFFDAITIQLVQCALELGE